MALGMKADAKAGSVDLRVPKSLYRRDAVEIAAATLERRCDALLGETARDWDLTLEAKRKGLGEEELLAIGGEFLNELLNQEYRRIVGAFNKRITDLVVTQALFSARGGEGRPAQADPEDPEFKKDVEAMMREAEEEIRRTMPKKIAPQGAPLPPASEEGGR